MSIQVIITLLVIFGLVFSLYKEFARPSFTFIGTVFILIIFQIITIEEFLKGLANKQIIIIFMLIILTTGIQKNIGSGFFFKLFRQDLSETQFRFRMMLFSGGLSSLVNNTPVVAFMIPYVKTWAEKKGYPASKFLIPLSYATILGGMITIVGTSTNLVLNGMIADYGSPILHYTDFLYLGLLVTISGLVYLSTFGGILLPDRGKSKDDVFKDLKEYLVETVLSSDSSMVGKSISDAGLRNLKELFLVEIERRGVKFPAVDPDEILQENDRIFFAGNTNAIFNLIKEKNGLLLPEHSHIFNNEFFELSEAIVPSGSSLVLKNLKESNFRDQFKGSVISIYRKGEKVKGNLGEIKLKAGDLLLIMIGKKNKTTNYYKDLIILNRQGEINSEINFKAKIPSIISIFLLLLGVFGFIDLFLAVFTGILCFFIFEVLNVDLVRKSIDLDLLLILISSLALGIALTKSGTAQIIVSNIFGQLDGFPVWAGLALLFILTLALTSLITNVAAVSIMFPIALELANMSNQATTPYFVVIAFAASADFITPIGYQTNLMVMGPGNYKFKDYLKVGLPLTVLYTLISIIFITIFYKI